MTNPTNENSDLERKLIPVVTEIEPVEQGRSRCIRRCNTISPNKWLQIMTQGHTRRKDAEIHLLRDYRELV